MKVNFVFILKRRGGGRKIQNDGKGEKSGRKEWKGGS